MKKEQNLTGILFSLPSLLILVTFYIYPVNKDIFDSNKILQRYNRINK
ncbi:MAG: hypothetical protein ACRC6Z_07655 [Cetobacterium sp.]